MHSEGGLLLGLLEATLRLLPIVNLPDRVDVSRFIVEKLQVKGVLPHVETDDGVVSDEGVLVLCLQHVQAAVCVTEPDPAGSLDTQSRRGKLGFELVKGAKISVDSLL